MPVTNTPPLDLDDIQGDVLTGFPKRFETLVFFTINDDVDAFRVQLTQLVPFITTTTQATDTRKEIAEHKANALAEGRDPKTIPAVGVAIAFSQFGITKLGIKDSIQDSSFETGQRNIAEDLGDKVDPNWLPAFKNEVHGVLVVAGDSEATIESTLGDIQRILGTGTDHATIKEVHRVTGNVRPPPQKGHEHFGFLDGISNPGVQGFDNQPLPGQDLIRPGFIILGHDTDPLKKQRPSWATGGSFMVFRYLFQLVPEFNTFLKKNPIQGPPPDVGSELLGARLVGRWKSGAPLDLVPTADGPALGADFQRNNLFRYDCPGDFENQDRCPFAAHVRKTNPRNDLEHDGTSIESRRIIRRGIPFGPEVSPSEEASGKTTQDRGLLFRCYQSNIANGFQFIQQAWANAPDFPPKGIESGFDPIIGQATDPTSRTIAGTDPRNQTATLSLPEEWVISKGGEYFFTPSITALRDDFAVTD